MADLLLQQAMANAKVEFSTEPVFDIKDFYVGFLSTATRSRAFAISERASHVDEQDDFWECINDEYGAADGVWKALFNSVLDGNLDDVGLYLPIAMALEDIVFKDCAESDEVPELSNPYI